MPAAAADLSPVARKFILHWGEMGSRWGVNRSVAQVHALLYISGRPLTAEEIAETLSMARSNVSTSLKELQGWRIVRVTQVLGDRRDRFETQGDVWEMFQTVLEERKRREIDPTMELLAACIAESGRGRDAEPLRRRLQEMLDFFSLMSDWYGQVRRLPRRALVRLFRMGQKVQRLLAPAG